MKRVFWILITPITLLLLFSFAFKKWVIPPLEQWTLQEIQQYSRQHLPFDIKIESLNISFLKPSVSLNEVLITPHTNSTLSKVFETASIRSVKAQLDLFQLIAGRLELSVITINYPSIQINLDPLLNDEGPSQALPLDQIFAISEKIPIERILLQNLYLDLKTEKFAGSLSLRQSSLLFSNLGKNLTAKTEIPDLRISSKRFGDYAGGLDSHLLLTRQTLKIIQTSVHLNDSDVSLRGELTDFKNVTISPEGVLQISSKLNLEEIYQNIRQIHSDKKIPHFSGTLQSETDFKFNGLKKYSGKLEIKTQKVAVDKFEFGDASLEGSIDKNILKISEMKVKHPAGVASLQSSEIELDDAFKFKTRLLIQSLDMQKLFLSLGLNHIPVSALAQGELPCTGQIQNGFRIDCDASIKAKDVWVRSHLNEPQSEILALDEISGNGHVVLDQEGVSYKTNLKLNDNSGTSDGEIRFHEGFLINFKTDSLNFKNIKNLAHLQFIGSAAIEGVTEGNSDAATFDMRVAASDFTFERFQLGNLNSDLKYRDGHLFFENLIGNQGRTQYLGSMDVDLKHNQINGQLKMPSLDIADITKIFENIYKFPLEVSGMGLGEIKFHGPLNFWKMNYQLDSHFKNILLARESFDQLTFNAEAKDGDIRAKKVLLQKNNSTVALTGTISSEKALNLNADARAWKLEESDTISKINANTFGVFNGTSEIRGTVEQPQVQIKGQISETVIEDQEIPKSIFTLNVTKTQLAMNLNLFGEKIIGDIQWPLNNSPTPLKIKMKTHDWQFSSMLALVGGGALVSEYDSSITSDINIASESGSIFKSSGEINISDVYLKRANYSMRNELPIYIKANNGLINLKNFYLAGPGNEISITGENFTSDALNINLNAQVELRLLHMFLPFLEDIGGSIETTANLSGSFYTPQILGTLSLTDGFVKIKAFPHPFEKIQSDVSFSHTKILLNSIKGQLAGGLINGDGNILINGYHDIPLNIHAKVEGASLNLPDQVRTSGQADLNITGRWFPFVLAGTYKVTSGLVTKEFGDDGDATTNSKQSTYLPKVLKQSTYAPLLLDMQVLIDKPLPVKNSLLDGQVTGNLNIKGAPQQPVLTGKINFEKNSRLIFKDKLFEILNGQVQMNNQNETEPDIYISAQARVTDYDVSLFVKGPPKTLKIKVNSVPPLSEQDIISLLALGVTSTQLDQSVQSKDQQTQSSYELGAVIIGAPVNKKLESTLGLNLQYSSSFDSTRNINVPKFTLSKKISKNVNASASRYLGDASAYDVKLQYQINQNVSAIGSYEKKDRQDSTLSSTTSQQDTQSFFGLDLEFKREFK